MSHPAYKPPTPALCTKAKVAKGGAYLWDTTVFPCGVWRGVDVTQIIDQLPFDPVTFDTF